MTEARLIQVQVMAQFAREEDGEIAEMLKPIVFTIPAAVWKKGWDSEDAFARALEQYGATEDGHV